MRVRRGARSAPLWSHGSDGPPSTHRRHRGRLPEHRHGHKPSRTPPPSRPAPRSAPRAPSTPQLWRHRARGAHPTLPHHVEGRVHTRRAARGTQRVHPRKSTLRRRSENYSSEDQLNTRAGRFCTSALAISTRRFADSTNRGMRMNGRLSVAIPPVMGKARAMIGPSGLYAATGLHGRVLPGYALPNGLLRGLSITRQSPSRLSSVRTEATARPPPPPPPRPA
mmetsp:Transcript_2007/g.6656  ORF Transcript_2007/g.6656 Transcript_2007/m.6656 type:complete len:223 (-) Transcript_2007:370-1038(-)